MLIIRLAQPRCNDPFDLSFDKRIIYLPSAPSSIEFHQHSPDFVIIQILPRELSSVGHSGMRHFTGEETLMHILEIRIVVR